jgi:cyclopropane fatty-acyl-phospholipid synthase-like methyltransferase
MLFIDTPIMYRELLFSKIKNNKKILIIDYENNYNNLFDNILLIKNLNLTIYYLIVNLNYTEIVKKKLKEYDYDKIIFINNDIEEITEKNYDNIIFFDLFSKFNNDKIKFKIEKCKFLLKNNGSLIFINNIITKYNQYIYHPLSYIRSFFIDNCIYMSDMYDKIKENELYIIDSYRLFTFQIPTYPYEIFSIICKFKN